MCPNRAKELNWTVPAPTPTCHRCGQVLRNGYCMGCTPLPPVPDGLTARHAETSLSEGAESVVRGWKVLGDPIRPWNNQGVKPEYARLFGKGPSCR